MEQAEARRWKVCVDDSWEEKAFAEDAAGLLGVGCVWPPRSYSCTFCRREFRSAQALGGHMNVHRRDRARLKQYTTTQHHHHQTLDLHRYSPYRNHKQQDQSCCIKDNINPSFVSNTTAPSVHQTIYTPDQPQLVSSFVIKKDSKNLSFLCYNNDYESSNNKFSKSHDDDDEKVTSFINLSSGSSPTTDEDSELLMNCPKRRKLDKTNEGQASKTTDAPKFEYLDLELRLGDRPKVQ